MARLTKLQQCDQTKPVCTRCSKSNHDCTYRDQSDLLFRNQTAVAAQKAERSWRKRSKSQQRTLGESISNETPPSDKSSPSSSSRQRSHHSSPNDLQNQQLHHSFEGGAPVAHFDDLTIVPELRSDIRHLAYERFLYDFVSPDSTYRSPGEPSDALWTFIPKLYQNAAKDSCLATVVNAVAYSNFANRCNVPQAETLAEECLGKGINLLSKTIEDKQLASSNDALCSVYLMGVYEV